MRNTIVLFAFFVSLAACNKTEVNAVNRETQSKTLQTTIVNVYYFHGNFRCHTCRNMENYSRETIEAYFKKEIESGIINFKTINIDQKGNEHYIKDYQLYTKTLIISVTKDGKEAQYKNLDKIWEYARDKEKFKNYVKSEVTGFLNIK